MLATAPFCSYRLVANSVHQESMEPRARVELATCRLRIGCSTTELPRPLIIKDLFPCLRDFHQTFIVLSRFRRRVAQLSQANARPVRSDPVLYRTAIATLPPPTRSLFSSSAQRNQIAHQMEER